MQFSSDSAMRRVALIGSAPFMIGTGLTIVLGYCVWPISPIASGVALIALGATNATIARGNRSSSACAQLSVHLFVYASLYLLLIGATFDAASRGPNGGPTFLRTIDLGVSAGVMALVVKTCVAAIIRSWDAPAR